MKSSAACSAHFGIGREIFTSACIMRPPGNESFMLEFRVNEHDVEAHACGKGKEFYRVTCDLDSVRVAVACL